jgi:hypothetical protein
MNLSEDAGSLDLTGKITQGNLKRRRERRMRIAWDLCFRFITKGVVYRQPKIDIRLFYCVWRPKLGGYLTDDPDASHLSSHHGVENRWPTGLTYIIHTRLFFVPRIQPMGDFPHPVGYDQYSSGECIPAWRNSQRSQRPR